MAAITPNVKLTIWNSLTDPYDSSQLAQNFISIDEHDHSADKGIPIPNGGLRSASGTEAVDTNVIRNNAITTPKIYNNAVTNSKVDDLAITSGKIGLQEVKNINIENLTITSGKIGNNEVKNINIDSDSVTEIKISTGAVTEGKIGTSAVTAIKIGTGAVTSDKILNDTIVNADINASAGIVDTKLSTISTAGKVANSATTATDSNTNSTIVARDGSGNFSAGTITASLSGNATTATNLAAGTTTLASNVVNSSITKLGTQAQDLDMGTKFIHNIAYPSVDTDAASKSYVDQMSVGLSKKAPVAVATTGLSTASPKEAYTVSGNKVTRMHFSVTPSIDGYTSFVAGASGTGTRILIKDAPITNVTGSAGTSNAVPNSTSYANGIYYVSSISSNDLILARDADMDAWSKVQNAYVLILNGTVNGATSYTADVSATTSGAIDSTAFKFTQFTAKINLIAGNGIDVSGSTISTNLATSNSGLEYSTNKLKVSADQSAVITTLGNITAGTISGATWAGNTISNTKLPDATTTVKGIASFATGDFAVSDGGVTVKSGGIDNVQLANSKVTIGSTDVNLGATATTIAGLTSVASTGFTGALTGNADTATKLAATKTINGVAFDGSANINVPTQNSLTIGTGLALDTGTTFNGSAARTVTIDSSVATLTGDQAFTNKTATLKAGNTSVAPLKFTPTAASLLTSPTAGSVEVGSDGKLYYTPSTTRKSVLLEGDTISNSQLASSGQIQIGTNTVSVGGAIGINGTPIVNPYISDANLSGTINTALTASSFVKTNGSSVLTTSSTIAASDFDNQTANTVLAGPSTGSATKPTFRALAAADLSSASATTSVQGAVKLAGDLSGTAALPTVGTSGNPITHDFYVGTHKIKNVVDPVDLQDAATKKYVDAAFGPTGMLNRLTTANIVANSWTYQTGATVIFNHTVYDNYNAAYSSWSNVTNTTAGALTAWLPGMYFIEAHVVWDASSGAPTGQRGMRIVKNSGAAIVNETRINYAYVGIQNVDFAQSVSGMFYSDGSDLFRIELLQKNTGDSGWGVTPTSFGIKYLGA